MTTVSSVVRPEAEVRPRPRARQEVIHYPDSDGEPMAGSDDQYLCITNTRFALEEYYADNPMVYIGADLLVYYVEGDPGKSVAPDVLVSLGVPKGRRRSYLLWEEGKPPDVVFEFASEHSWRPALGWKRGLYLGLGVREYFLFDPSGEYFQPVLQGFRLVEGNYVPMEPLAPAEEKGILGLRSQVMGLELWAKRNGGEGMPYVLRLYDPAAGRWLPTPAEEAAARREAEARAAEAEARAAREAEARKAAEVKLAQLEAELARLRGEK